MLVDLAVPAAFAAFVWWFSTGALLLVNGLPRRLVRWNVAGASAVAVAALAGLRIVADGTSVAHAYAGFALAILVWGWHELTFLSGALTGPRRAPSPAGKGDARHFIRAVEAIAYHELAIAAVGVLLVAMTWGEPNQVGTWTFVVLWVMRVSAKLNLFLGVPNTGEELLPPHLAYLRTFFRRRAMNLLFPVSITASTAVAALLVREALAPRASPFEEAALALVGTLLILAILEHWLMVLPIQATALWRWAMRTTRPLPTEAEPRDWEVSRAALDLPPLRPAGRK